MDSVAFLAHLVEGSLPNHPLRARKLLAAGYKTVALKGKLAKTSSYAGAVDSFNGFIAQTIIDALMRPQNAVMLNIYLPCEPLYALGATAMFPEGISVYVTCTQLSLPFVQAAEAVGIPESFCSYHKQMLGMDMAGVLPKPAMIANTTLACDANQLSFRLLAEKPDGSNLYRSVIEVPYVGAELKPGDEEREALVYDVASQLEKMTEDIARMFDRELSEEALCKRCEVCLQTLKNTKEFLALRKDISLPTTLTGELCQLIATHNLCGTDEALEFSEHLLELAKAAQKEQRSEREQEQGSAHEKAQGAVHEQAGKKKPRIFWLHTLPNWQQSVMDIFETTEATLAKAEIVGNDMAYDQIDFLEELEPSKPYDFMARRLVLGSSNGPATRRIKAALAEAQEAGADGAIVFAHWGCRQTGGLAQIAKDTFEVAGIPLLVLDGDGCDSRNASDGQMVTRLEAFIEQFSQ